MHYKIILEKFPTSPQQSLKEIKTIGVVVLSQLSNEWLHKVAACLYDIPVTLAVAVFFKMLLVLDDLLDLVTACVLYVRIFHTYVI